MPGPLDLLQEKQLGKSLLPEKLPLIQTGLDNQEPSPPASSDGLVLQCFDEDMNRQWARKKSELPTNADHETAYIITDDTYVYLATQSDIGLFRSSGIDTITAYEVSGGAFVWDMVVPNGVFGHEFRWKIFPIANGVAGFMMLQRTDTFPNPITMRRYDKNGSGVWEQLHPDLLKNVWRGVNTGTESTSWFLVTSDDGNLGNGRWICQRRNLLTGGLEDEYIPEPYVNKLSSDEVRAITLTNQTDAGYGTTQVGISTDSTGGGAFWNIYEADGGLVVPSGLGATAIPNLLVEHADSRADEYTLGVGGVLGRPLKLGGYLPGPTGTNYVFTPDGPTSMATNDNFGLLTDNYGWYLARSGSSNPPRTFRMNADFDEMTMYLRYYQLRSACTTSNRILTLNDAYNSAADGGPTDIAGVRSTL